MGRTAIGLGLIGCGWIAELVHMPNLKAQRGISLRAFADRDAARRAVAARLFPAATAHAEPEALLADPGVEAVVVALPPGANRAVLEAAFRAGKDVYVEKPLAASTPDAEAIAVAWRASGRIAMLGYNFRRNPVVEDALARVRAGELGEVATVQSQFTWAAAGMEGWRAEPAAGGGALLELASHHIDLFAALTGGPLARTSARERSMRYGGDTVDLTVEASGGAVLQHHASLAAGANANRLRILGTRGQLEVDLLDAVPRRSCRVGERAGRLAQFRRAAEGLHPARLLRAQGYEPSFARTLDAFVAACRDRRQPEPGVAAGLAVLQVIDAARASIADAGAPAAIAPSPAA